MNHAVITGDIVRSKQLSADEFKRAQESLRQGSAGIRQRFPENVPLPLELFRGDGWQLLVTPPARALRVAFYLRAFLHAEADADTRFAIGVGPIDAIPEKSVATGRGEAFRLSGALLDGRVATHMRFAVAGPVPDGAAELMDIGPETRPERDARAISVMLVVLDVLLKNWTRPQARAVCGALLDQTQEKIAEGWNGEGITQQAVAQHLARAGWDGVREALAFYEHVATEWA